MRRHFPYFQYLSLHLERSYPLSAELIAGFAAVGSADIEEISGKVTEESRMIHKVHQPSC
jgi:hypothetical protein